MTISVQLSWGYQHPITSIIIITPITIVPSLQLMSFILLQSSPWSSQLLLSLYLGNEWFDSGSSHYAELDPIVNLSFGSSSGFGNMREPVLK